VKLNWLIQTPLKTNTPDISNIDPTGIRPAPDSHGSYAPNSLTRTQFLAAWRWWLPPALIGLVLVLYFVDPFIGDWDGLDYTMHSLAGYPSSMALGRNLFIFGNHALFVVAKTIFNLQPENAYLLFKYAVVAQAPFAVIACWLLAQSVSQSFQVATLSAVLIICSPVFVLYGGQVMTDVPSVMVLGIALVVHLRGVREKKLWMILLGAGLLGLGVNLRETVAFFLPWLVLAPVVCWGKPRRRELIYISASLVVFAVLAFGWFTYWFVTDPYYRQIWYGWRQSMDEESSRHPVALANLRPYIAFLFITAPLVFITLPFAPIREWRQRGLSILLALWLVSFFADVLLFFNYSTTVNWRYFLTGLPGLAPLASQWLLATAARRVDTHRRAFVICVSVCAAIAITFSFLLRPVSFDFIQRRAMSKDYRSRLKDVPADAVMISGAQTIAVTYWKNIGAGRWTTIGTGGGWPGERLFSVVEDYFAKNQRVFIDSDPRWWVPCGWQREEIPLIVQLEDRFRFRRVNDTIFELRPLSDKTALDTPNLKRLLPENRPEDIRKCRSSRIQS
jgi:hypothetical protein